ncbi:MAG: zinc metallopeptidase [Pigmentiphaga sp.]|nr:zinc metallopeptidase [Pigmentiphaga sp.]
MRLDHRRQSANIEDRRQQGPRLGRTGSIGIGTIVLALVAMYFGIDPNVVLNMADNAPAPSSSTTPATDADYQLVSKVLAGTEDTWKAIFQKSGQSYQEARLVLFSGATPTACGTGQSAMGPFYCPGDNKVYLDTRFFNDMQTQLGANGDFAQAYVIAHEVGHHVQNLLGISREVQRQQAQLDAQQANALSVRTELQADCFAGIWAYHAQHYQGIIESGDIEEAINAAAAIGDDRLQKRSQGYVVPDTFTHGSSAQRVRWFEQGFKTGDPARCDTFSAARL